MFAIHLGGWFWFALVQEILHQILNIGVHVGVTMKIEMGFYDKQFHFFCVQEELVIAFTQACFRSKEIGQVKI